MELYQPHFYIIRALEDMHPGSGNTNQGTIDNLVQRDSTDGIPCIYDTSLKGALREYADYLCSNQTLAEEKVERIFGSKPLDQERSENAKAGTWSILQAFLVSIPVACSHKPFYRATSISILENLAERMRLFGYAAPLQEQLSTFTKYLQPQMEEGKGLIFSPGTSIRYFEEFSLSSKTINPPAALNNVIQITGPDLVVFTEKDFSLLTDDNHLPVKARNRLDNGESKNLWYEQVLPRETRFYFTVLQPVVDPAPEDFQNIFHNKVVQIGANASVGNGWSLITQMNVI